MRLAGALCGAEPWIPVRQNVPLGEAMTLTGHRSVQTIMSTFRPAPFTRARMRRNETILSVEAGKSKNLLLTGWLMTSTSLDREKRYPVLMVWRVKTAYAVFVISLHGIEKPLLLAHEIYNDEGGFPMSRAGVGRVPFGQAFRL
jgi:hypothetical protein